MVRILLISLTAFFFVSTQVLAQERTVSGKVTSAEDGSSLPGVNVVLKGTTEGSITDAEGNYTLSVPASGGTLVFTFIGLTMREEEIGSRSTVDVQMQEDVTQLSEIVVTGYSEIEQKKLVSSIAVVGGESIENVPLADINQIIQGRAPGVYSTSPSGQPGAAQNIRIRGTGSISAGRGPLYVIDGIIIQNGDFTTQTQTNDVLSSINPNDIESINVLKDAAATALYGSRGANGVVLINTKRGKRGQSTITARAQYGVTVPNFGNFIMMDGPTVLEYERQMLRNSGVNEAGVEAARPLSMLDRTFDWVDGAFRQGKTSNYELQTQGGDQRTTYFVSGGVFHQDGTLIESSFERYSLRTNLDHKLNDKLDFGLNLNVSYTSGLNAVAGNRFASPLLGAFVNTPLQHPIDPNTGRYYTGRESDFIIFTNDNFLYSQPLNPVTNNNLRTIAKLNVGYNILENLKLSQTLAADLVNIREKAFFDPTTNDGIDDNGSISEAYNENRTLTSQTKLAGGWSFGSDHALDGLLVMEFQKNDRSNFGATGIGLASGKLQTLNSTATPQGVSGFGSNSSFVSYLGQLNYGLLDRYFVTASLRRDGSSRFGTDNRYANFWSAGLSWVAKQESFLQGFETLSDLKVRVSYGTAGNAEIGDFASLGLYGFGSAYLGNPGSAPSQISNPDLKWEISTSTNVGVDFGFFDNRIKTSVDLYRRVSSELLLDVPVSSTSGFTTATQNIGEVENKGIEVLLTTVNSQGALQWTTDFNITMNRNKVLTLNNGEDIANGAQRISEGKPIRSWYMRKWAGVNPADGTPLWLTDNGDVTGSSALADLFYVGNAEPRYIGGLNNSLTYKGINLSFFFYFAVGHEVNNTSKPFVDSDGQRYGWGHLVEAGEDYWQNPGDIASRPQPRVGGNNSSNVNSTRYLENGSYLRLRNIVLSYNLPSTILSKIGFRNARLYLQGQNLLTVTDYSGFDPEMDESGSEFFRYPVGKSYTGGIELTF